MQSHGEHAPQSPSRPSRIRYSSSGLPNINFNFSRGPVLYLQLNEWNANKRTDEYRFDLADCIIADQNLLVLETINNARVMADPFGDGLLIFEPDIQQYEEQRPEGVPLAPEQNPVLFLAYFNGLQNKGEFQEVSASVGQIQPAATSPFVVSLGDPAQSAVLGQQAAPSIFSPPAAQSDLFTPGAAPPLFTSSVATPEVFPQIPPSSNTFGSPAFPSAQPEPTR
jgi:hypothetical protein